MAIADKLRTQASSLGQGISNANSGTALIQIADKAMSEQSNILDIVKTKLIQAATSTTSAEGREAVRKDVSKLLDQLDNISEQTNYNGINLLNQKGAEFNFQVGEDSTFDIGLATAYSVNTTGLGAGDIALNDEDSLLNFSDANNTVGIKGVGGQFTVKYDENPVTALTAVQDRGIQIGVTANGVGTIAGDVAFSVVANDVKGLAFAGGSYNLETNDMALKAALDNAATNSATTGVTKVGDGQYTTTTTLGVDFGGTIDITDLRVSGFTTGSTGTDTLTVVTDSEVSVTKDAGAAYIGLAAATVAMSNGSIGAVANELLGKTSATSDAVSYSIIASATGVTGTSGLIVEKGTVGVQVETEKASTDSGISTGGSYAQSAQAAVQIENAYSGTVASNSGESIYTLNAYDVKELVFTNTTLTAAGSYSVTMSTNNANSVKMLDELASNNAKLTKVGEGAYSFAVTTTGNQQYSTLDFGGADVLDLTISGQELGEDIALVTTGKVFVTKEDSDDDADIRLKAVNVNDSTKAIDDGGQLNGASGDILKTSTTLAGLKGLAEGGLTADIANTYMSVVDNAMTQLNSVRSDFGSTQGQLEVATRNMMVTQVNIKAAESVIRDVDYAAESANFNKQNIIAQAGTYAMSQANAVSQNVLRLLQ
jgi:flagellin